MTTQSPPHQDYQEALNVFIQTTTIEEAHSVLQQYPNLLTDQADLLFSSIITTARKQGQESIAQALDERRDFIREVRELSEKEEKEE